MRSLFGGLSCFDYRLEIADFREHYKVMGSYGAFKDHVWTIVVNGAPILEWVLYSHLEIFKDNGKIIYEARTSGHCDYHWKGSYLYRYDY